MKHPDITTDGSYSRGRVKRPLPDGTFEDCANPVYAISFALIILITVLSLAIIGLTVR